MTGPSSGRRREAIAAWESDAQLVERVRVGSMEALGDLYERHADVLYQTAFRILGTKTEAEDVVQDLFVGLPRALVKYEERGSLIGWLRAVAVRSALMSLRRRGRSVACDEAMLDAVTGAEEPRGEESDATSRIAIERALAALPEKLRVVFVLREVEGYAHREIGELLGISATASAIRLHRAWKELMKRSDIE